MDNKEEQRSELEALEAIFPNELTVISSEPYPSFTVSIESTDEECDDRMSALLRFTFTADYPNEVPDMCIESSENLSEEDETEFLKLLQDEAFSELGQVMIFQLISSSIEWLKQTADNKKEKAIQEEENRKQKEEEEERKRFEGTRVTVESFLAWKIKFDQEREELKKQEAARLEYGTRRLTGRELFEKDKSLNESDLQFLQEGESEVQVDESLFQELDGLDLEEDTDIA